MSSRVLLAILSLALALLIAFVATSLVNRESAHATPLRETTAGSTPSASTPHEITAAPDEAPAAAAGDQRATTLAAVTGRVIDVESGKGVAGFWTQCWNGAELVGESGSDATGYFQLPAPVNDGASELHARVRLQPLWGWTLLAKEHKLDPRADGTFEEVVFRVRPARFGKLRGKLVDIDTGELVPDYMLRVGTTDGSREQVVSDAKGVFTTEHEYAEGTLSLAFHDIETSLQGANEEKLCYATEIQHDPRATEPLTIPIPVGPTYALEFDAPARALKQPLFARLMPAQFPKRIRIGASDAQVRGVESRWVRFGPDWARRRFWPMNEPWVLAVASTDGIWTGYAPIQSMRGIHPTPLSIHLEECAQLLGRLRDRAGQPIGQANVTIAALNATAPEESPSVAQSGGNGLFSFELLSAGTYLVTAVSPQHSVGRQEVTVHTGERNEMEMVLEPALVAGAIAGQLVRADDPSREWPRVMVMSINPDGRLFSQAVQWEHRGEQWLAPFRFDALPAGDYEVRLSHVDITAWTPVVLRVTAPADDLTFTRVSSGPCVQFVAIDAASGERLPSCTAMLLSSGASTECWTIEAGWDCIDHAGELDADARWIVSADEHAPYWGTRAELTAVEDGFQGRALLRRGWGIELVAFGPGFAPLVAAEIELDGEPAGKTDRDGVLRIVRDTRPSRIDVRYRDWRVDATSREELWVALEHAMPRAVVFLAPR